MKKLKAVLCGRFRLPVSLALAFLVWGASWLVLLIREDWKLDKFRTLKIGMSRSEVVKIVGEPFLKRDIKVGLGIFPDMPKSYDGSIEYTYYLKNISSSSGMAISGIMLDNNEKRIEFINLKTEIIDVFRIGESLPYFLAFGATATLILFLLGGWCRRSK